MAASVASSLAQNTLIPITTRRDMVFDHAGSYLYVTATDGYLRRYNLSTNVLDAAFIGGSLNGVDISADDSFLLIGQSYTDGPQGLIHKLDTATGNTANITYALESGEGGSWEIAIASNGTALITTQPTGNNWTPLRQINLSTNVVTERTDTPGSGPHGWLSAGQICRSADRSRAYILETDISSGPLFTYSASTDGFSAPIDTYYSLTFASAAVNRNGTLIATRITDNASIDQISDWTFLHDFSGIDFGVAFDAKSDTFYAVKPSSDQIIAYDANTFSEKFRLNIGETLGPSGFSVSRLVASQDGRYIALTTPSGVRVFAISAGTPSTKPIPTLTTRRDIVFDHSGQFAYITTSDGFVERYNLSNGNLEIVRDLGGSLYGVDIAADDSFLLVAQGDCGVAEGAFQKLNLASGNITNIDYPRSPQEIGTWSVAIGLNGSALGTTQFNGSGWVPLRQIDLATNTVWARKDVPGSNGSAVTGATIIHRSADHTRFYFWEADISSGPVFTYSATTNTFGPNLQTGFFAETCSAAVNRNGSLLATRIGTHATIDTAPDYNFVRPFNGLDGGVAFDAVAEIFYAVNTVSDQIVAYNTNNFAEQFRISVGESLYSDYTTEFGTGTLVASQDGHYLALATQSGVRFYALPVGAPAPTPTPAPTSPRDIVFDHSGAYLYIGDGDGFVHRYNISNKQFEAHYDVGGSLNGIDVAPDDSFLVIAQGIGGLKQGAFQKLDLSTSSITNINYNYQNNLRDDLPWDVAIIPNGTALVSTGYNIRQLDPTTGSITVRADVPTSIYPNTIVARGADRSRLYFLDQLSDGGLFTYTIATDTFGPNFFTNTYNVSGAISRNGSLVARRTSSHAYLETVPNFTGLQLFDGLDSGVAFDATKDNLYGVSTTSDQIIAFDTTTFVEKFRLAIGEHVPPIPVYQPARFGSGRLVASQDGRDLALITPTAVRMYDVSAGPSPTPAPTPIVSISSSGRVTEGGSATFQITATNNTARPVTVNYSLSGKATFGVDYTLSNNLRQSGQVTIPVGSDSVTVTLSALIDHIKEKKDSITMKLSGGSGYKFAKSKKPPSAKVSFVDSP
jgi:hypothetical protein